MTAPHLKQGLRPDLGYSTVQKVGNSPTLTGRKRSQQLFPWFLATDAWISRVRLAAKGTGAALGQDQNKSEYINKYL